MAYIGHTPAEKYVSLAVQHFSVTATANYTLTNSITSANELALYINNVRQEPGAGYAYTAAGTALTLSAATAASDTMYCVYLGKSVGTISPPAGSVSSASIVDGTITNDDLAGSITESKLAGSISSAKITSLDATKLTGTVADARFPATLPASSGANLTALPAANLTGSIADARVPASAVTQHVVATDLTSVRQDIAMLAIYNSVSDNRAAYNLPSSFIDTFQDDTGLTTQTDVVRNATGEYVSSGVITDGDDSYTKMLLHMEDTAIANTASSATVNPTTLGACSRSNAVTAKFGSYSMGTTGGSGVKFAYDSSWMANMATQSHTIDFWYRFTTYPSSPGYALFNGDTDGQYSTFRHHHPTMNYPHTGGVGWGGAETGTKTNFTQNQWYHVAQVYDSTSGHKGYIDGVLDMNEAATGSTAVGSNLSIMGDWGGGNTYYPAAGCYMDEFRISVGIARWTANFTPYTAAYGSVSVNATGTLISDTQTASASTTSMSGCILYKDNAGTATLGTHLKIYLSANGGTNWTEVPSYGAVTPLFSTGVKMVRLPKTTVTAGTTPVMKAVWASQSASLDTQLHGWAMNY